MGSNAVAVPGLEFSAGIAEQPARFGNEFIGFHLAFTFGAVALQIQPQHIARFFNRLHRFAAVAMIIVIGHFEEDIRVGQFLAGSFSAGGCSHNESCRKDCAGDKTISES